MYKHRLQNEPKRGIFYGQVAIDAAAAASEPMWKLGALNELGIIYESDSQFPSAIDCFRQALELIDGSAIATTRASAAWPSCRTSRTASCRSARSKKRSR